MPNQYWKNKKSEYKHIQFQNLKKVTESQWDKDIGMKAFMNRIELWVYRQTLRLVASWIFTVVEK